MSDILCIPYMGNLCDTRMSTIFSVQEHVEDGTIFVIRLNAISVYKECSHSFILCDQIVF